jgi:hypothetical protein
MITHFGAKHQDTPLPMNIPLRVSGAKDFKLNCVGTKARQEEVQGRLLQVRKERQGYSLSVWMGREGLQDSRTRLLCKGLPGRAICHTVFLWRHQEKLLARILVEFIDDSRMLVEVKPLAQCPTPDGGAENWTQAQTMPSGLPRSRIAACEMALCRMDRARHTTPVKNPVEMLSKSELTK